jgi:hypothetical protein
MIPEWCVNNYRNAWTVKEYYSLFIGIGHSLWGITIMPLIKVYNNDSDPYGLKGHSIFKLVRPFIFGYVVIPKLHEWCLRRYVRAASAEGPSATKHGPNRFKFKFEFEFDHTRDNHSIVVWVILELKVLLREGNWNVRPSWLDEGSLHPDMLYPSLCLLLLFLVGWLWAWTACYREYQLRSRSSSSLIVGRSHQLKKVEVSSPEVGANVGDLFSNAMN